MIEATESQICIALFEWSQYNNIFLIHIPNEGKRGNWGNAQQKKIGLIKGFPDYFIAHANKLFHGMFLEIKKSGKKPTKEQIAIMDRLKEQGYFSSWADSIDGAISLISSYLNI
jgi:hypothetical protein